MHYANTRHAVTIAYIGTLGAFIVTSVIYVTVMTARYE